MCVVVTLAFRFGGSEPIELLHILQRRFSQIPGLRISFYELPVGSDCGLCPGPLKQDLRQQTVPESFRVPPRKRRKVLSAPGKQSVADSFGF